MQTFVKILLVELTACAYPDTDIVGPGYKGASPSDDGDWTLPSMYDVVLSP